MDLDPRRFPLAAKYLAGLPEGLASFPGCEIHVDSFSFMRQTHPNLATTELLPEAAREVLLGNQRGDWIPEVLGNVLYLLLRDTAFHSDAEFLDWARQSSAATYSKPWARVIMHVLSPTLIVMGAGKRWSTFHRGSMLTPEKAAREGERISIRGILTYPAGLFDELLLQRYCRAFEAAIIAAKAQHPVADLASIDAGRSIFVMSWDA
jgi:hypothetical protein